jgi:hypothetical protein
MLIDVNPFLSFFFSSSPPPPSLQIKTFTPIVLFNHHENNSHQLSVTHNNHSLSNEDRHTQSLIEQHRLKTKELLAQNAQLWEKEGYGYSKTKSASISGTDIYKTTKKHVFSCTYTTSTHSFLFVGSDQCSPSTHVDSSKEKLNNANKSFYKFRTLFTPDSTTQTINSSNMCESTKSISSSVDNLNNSVAIATSKSASTANSLQQRELYTPYVNTISRSDNFVYQDDHEEDPEEEHDPLMTTTFITEPQFHHTYRPNIGRKRRRGNLPKQVTEYLKRWLILHKKHPYPTEREKQKLADETGLMVSQISNWFINARRRILQPLLESEHQDSINNNTNADTSTMATNVIPRSRTVSTTDVTPASTVDAPGTPEPATTSSTYHHKYIIGNFGSNDGHSRQHSTDDIISLDDEYDEPQQQQQTEHDGMYMYI